MSTILAPAAVWQPEDYIFFRKCGEITISPDMQNIGFNCLFCTGICLQADIFQQHLQEQHQEEIFKLYEQQNATLQHVGLEEMETQQNFKMTRSYKINETGENGIMCDMFTPTEVVALTTPTAPTTTTSDLNSLYDLGNHDLLTLTSSQELENLITINPLEILNNNNSSTFTVVPSSTTNIACSGGGAPDDNNSECEIGDGEDSGIIMVQSPGTSECGGFSDCMSFTEDSNSNKSTNNFDAIWPSPTAEFEKQNSASEQRDADETHQDDIKPLKPKGKYIKTPAISKALNNKDLISYLLKAYRKNGKLWNPEHPSYKYNARRTIYNELSKPLFEDMNYSLSGNEIFAIINELRGRYRRELTKFQTRKGKHKTRLWYFEQMDFLRKIIEAKRKERIKDKEISKSDTHNKNIANRQVLSYLLDLYKHFECLWNPNDSEYESCNKSEVLEEITLELQDKFNICITEKECLHEIQKLRIRYRKELRILHKLKGLYITKLWCFDEMDFLRPIMEEKITKTLKKNSCHITNQFSQSKHDFLKAEEIHFADLEQHLQFIEIYRSYSSLWDVDHPDYRSTNYRNKALNEMLEQVNLTFTPKKVELEQLEKTIYQMRRDFSTEKQNRLIKNDNSSITNSDDDTKFSLLLYEKLSEFLTINLGPFRCADCQKICKTYDQYKIHLSKHDGNLPFICTLCGKGFQMPGNLTIHIRRHRRDFPYACEICKKSFATSTEVSIHMRTHTGERPYVCDFCDKTFKTWSFFDIHKRTHLKQSNFHCPICDKSFYERNRFTDHMNVHLNIRKHQCEQCGKGFTTFGNLKKHLELHASVKKYKCLACGKSFAQFASLRWHRKAQHEQ